MIEDRLFVLIGKKVNDEMTQAEQEELAQLLEQTSMDSHSLELLREVWSKHPKEDVQQVNEKWNLLKARLGEEEYPIEYAGPGRKNVLKWTSVLIAASVLVVTFVYFKNAATTTTVAKSAEVIDSVIVVRNGERKRIVMPDGSRIQLNSGSVLEFNGGYGVSNREVSLTGEAYFEVVKSPALPFLVNTTRMVVKVVGTSFNVKAYDTQEDIETTVVEGKVEVSLKDDLEKKVILMPSEKISIRKNDATQQHLKYEVEVARQGDDKEDKTALPQELAWTEDKIFFSEEPFETVALKMERWYDVTIYFRDEEMKSILMTGDFHDVDIQRALQILQMMVNFEYEIEGDKIYIRKQ